jgi:hypothetical protein
MGLVYVPTTGVTKHGLYRVIEPVSVVPASDRDGLSRALAETLARGNPEVPALKPSDYPPPVLPKYAGVKNWNSFSRNASLWGVTEHDGIYKILGYQRHAGGGWLQDKKQELAFPADTSVEAVIDRMITILQGARRGRGNAAVRQERSCTGNAI